MPNSQQQNSPGIGAIEYAETFIEGLDRDVAKTVIKRLLAGDLHDGSDKRVKTCSHCGYPYRDKTKPNNGKTCSKECKRAADKLEKKKKRADQSLLEPKKKSKWDDVYAHWLEYPFFANEEEMFKYSRSYENPRTPEKVEIMDGAARRGIIGRKKKKLSTPYDGRDTFAEDQQHVEVKTTINSQLHKHKKAKQHGDVKTYYINADEMDTLVTKSYSKQHLQQERTRAKGKTWKKYF